MPCHPSARANSSGKTTERAELAGNRPTYVSPDNGAERNDRIRAGQVLGGCGPGRMEWPRPGGVPGRGQFRWRRESGWGSVRRGCRAGRRVARGLAGGAGEGEVVVLDDGGFGGGGLALGGDG